MSLWARTRTSKYLTLVSLGLSSVTWYTHSLIMGGCHYDGWHWNQYFKENSQQALMCGHMVLHCGKYAQWVRESAYACMQGSISNVWLVCLEQFIQIEPYYNSYLFIFRSISLCNNAGEGAPQAVKERIQITKATELFTRHVRQLLKFTSYMYQPSYITLSPHTHHVLHTSQ